MAEAKKGEKKQAPVTAGELRDQMEARLHKLEEIVRTHNTRIRDASAQALKSVANVEQAVVQEFASKKDVRKRMKAVRKEIRKLRKASRKELSSLGKATERELSAFGATLKNVADAITATSPKKSKKTAVEPAAKQAVVRKSKAPAAKVAKKAGTKRSATRKTPAKRARPAPTIAPPTTALADTAHVTPPVVPVIPSK